MNNIPTDLKIFLALMAAVIIAAVIVLATGGPDILSGAG